MGKRKRRVKWTVYLVKEGERREQGFYEFLYNLYQPKQRGININSSKENGGSSSSLLYTALRMKNNYHRVFAWIDEDVKLSKEARNVLAQAWNVSAFPDSVKDKDLQRMYNKEKRNPILIVSNPCSCDGFLLQLCEIQLPKTLTTDNCKNTFMGATQAKTKEEEIAFYQKRFSLRKLQSQREKFEVLDLLLSIFEKV